MSVFGVTCLRLQRLASSVGFGTTVQLAPKKNLRVLRVTYCKPGGSGSSDRFCPPIKGEREIVLEKRGVSADTASPLARYCGNSAEMWAGLQAYRATMGRSTSGYRA
jgi:hypothetical protein